MDKKDVSDEEHPLSNSNVNSSALSVTGSGSVTQGSQKDSVLCSFCKQTRAKYMCSHCSKAYYCSINCQRKDWPKHCQTWTLKDNQMPNTRNVSANSSPHTQTANDAASDAESAAKATPEDLMFYLEQIFIITKPVVVCIILSVFWVKMTTVNGGTSVQSAYSYIQPAGSGSSTSAQAINGLVQAAIILGNIVVATVIIVFLFIKGWILALMIFFCLVVAMLLGYFGWYLIFQLFYIWNVNIDWVTTIVLLFNSTVVGVMCIFWRGPKELQQVYLVLMCTLMAYTLTGLPEWTAWIFMAFLVIWDLIAVLCPFGPLRLLIENARQAPQNTRPLQALMYSAMVWIGMINQPEEAAETPFVELGRKSLSSISNKASIGKHTGFQVLSQQETSPNTSPLTAPDPRSPDPLLPPEQDFPQANLGASPLLNPSPDTLDAGLAPLAAQHENTALSSDSTPEKQQAIQEEEEEEEERSGLKLGLGDFVFYSLLVSRAAMFDWITTIACMIAVLSGLDATIFLLAMFRKALPALPISLTFGIIFYFVSRIMMTPFFSSDGLILVFGNEDSTSANLNLISMTAGMVMI